MKRKFCTLILLMGMWLFLMGCGSEETENATQREKESTMATKDVFAMDTYMTLTAYGSEAQEAVTKAEQEIKRLDALLSVGNKNSEIYKLNKEGKSRVGKDVSNLLIRSKEIYEATEGLFDITIYPLMEEWGFTTEEYNVPGQATIDSKLQRVDFSKIQIKKELVTFENTNMAIDLGGIAKGYTSARIMDIYRECGIESGMVSLGGNVQLYGSKPDGEPWKVGIRNPEDEKAYIGILKAEDVAIITSGGYERYFEKNGKKYHHILDPRTGYPTKSGLKSVTIVSKDGTLADGLSTALFIMGEEKATEFWKKHNEEFDIILQSDDGTVIVSEGVADQFECYFDVKTVHKE